MPGTLLGVGDSAVNTMSCGALYIWSVLNLQLPEQCLVHSRCSVFIYLHFFGAALGPCCHMQAFSSCDEQSLLSGYSMRASDCGGFSYCGAWVLGCVGSDVAIPGP